MFKLKQHQQSFIPFIMAGVPSLNETREAILFLDRLGVAAIELGVPFTDPIADGPVNQEAAIIALKNKTTLRLIFSLIQDLQSHDFKTPIILFTYLNPILALGVEEFIKLSKASNIQSVLIVDLPVEEGKYIYHELDKSDISPVFLISPTTQLERYKICSSLSPAFIYYISRCDVTGMNDDIRETLSDEVVTVKAFFHKEAIAVGFGVSTAEHAKKISTYADGVIVGSVLMKHLNRGDLQSFKTLAADIQQAISETSHEKN